MKDYARQMDTNFILIFLNAKLNFRHFEFEVMEMLRNEIQIQSEDRRVFET